MGAQTVKSANLDTPIVARSNAVSSSERLPPSTQQESNSLPTVRVLMSTYDGEEYVSELLTSVQHQIGVTVRWWVRDDGSRDGTVRRLSDFQKTCNMQLSCGANKGIVASYLELIRTCPLDADYYAFCDQDDVWLPPKLKRACQMLANAGLLTPSLYCSRLVIVDKALRNLGFSRVPRRPVGFGNALVENVATGCTIVLNRAAFSLLQSAQPDATKVVVHDFWGYLVVSAFGHVIYDPRPYILYRQHGHNAIGMRQGPGAKLARRLQSLTRVQRLSIPRQDCELRRLYGSVLPPASAALLERHLGSATSPSLRVRMTYAMSGAVYRQGRMDDPIMRVIIALGGYRGIQGTD